MVEFSCERLRTQKPDAKRKRDRAQPQDAKRKRDSAQPEDAKRKRDSAQPEDAKRKRDSAQPEEKKRGCAIKKMSRSRDGADGEVRPIPEQILIGGLNEPPRPRRIRCLRDILLMAR